MAELHPARLGSRRRAAWVLKLSRWKPYTFPSLAHSWGLPVEWRSQAHVTTSHTSQKLSIRKVDQAGTASRESSPWPSVSIHLGSQQVFTDVCDWVRTCGLCPSVWASQWTRGIQQACSRAKAGQKPVGSGGVPGAAIPSYKCPRSSWHTGA